MAPFPVTFSKQQPYVERNEQYDLGYQPDRKPDLIALLPATPQWPRDPV